MAKLGARGLVRAEMRGLGPVVHGSIAAEELRDLGFQLGDIVDFSVNTNPLGPAPTVLQAVMGTEWTRYPGDDEAPLKAALGQTCGVAPSRIALGNGSAELLWLLALAILEPGDRVAIAGPTFGEYARATRVAGGEPFEVRNGADDTSARLMFLCNPNNPTGAYLSESGVIGLLEANADRILVLDEAYAAFVAAPWQSTPLLERFSNLAILRSMTKDHALPGLRLGYLIASEEITQAINAIRPPWNVNAGALRAGLAVMEPRAQVHVAEGRRVVAESREILSEGLRGLGIPVEPSAANFLLAHVGDGAGFRRALLEKGLVVRDCASFGLPEHVRIACRMPDECRRLLAAIEGMTRGG